MRATTKLVIYTLVGSFFMLVAAVATGVLASSEHGTPLTSPLARCSTCRSRTPRRRGSSCASRSPSWSRCRWSRSTAGWPTATRRCRSRSVAVFSGILSKVAAYGFLRIVLPLFPYASVHFQTLMLLIALVSILWAHPGGVDHARRPAGGRLLERRPARLHRARDLLADDPGRPGRAAADGQPRARHGAAVLHRRGGSRRARAARRSCADMGGIAFRAPVLATLFLIVTLANLAMPGSVELRRRVHDPARRVQRQAADRDDRLARRRRRGRLRPAAVHPRDAQPGRPAGHLVRDLRWPTPSRSCRWSP